MILEKIVEQAELEPDAERSDDRGHNEARDRDEEQEPGARKPFAERETGRERQEHGQDHHHDAELERAQEGVVDVDDAAAGPQTARTSGATPRPSER